MKLAFGSLTLLLSTILGLFAQETSDYKYGEPKSLFNVKREPESCGCNLENLFENWSTDLIANADDLKLLSYTYLGTISDKEEVIEYAKKMTTYDSPLFSHAGYTTTRVGMIGEQPKNQQFFSVTTANKGLIAAPEEDRAEGRRHYDNMLEGIRAGIILKVKKGCKVYSINFLYKGEPMETFLFCDPLSYDVWDLHFSGFSFLLYQ